LVDAAQPRQAPAGIAHFHNQQIRRDQRRIVTDDRKSSVAIGFVDKKPFERNAGIDDEAHPLSRASRISSSAVG